MEKIKQYKYIILIAVAILGFAFYWFEWRPAQIRKKCYDIAVVIVGNNFDKNYESCLLDNGLEEIANELTQDAKNTNLANGHLDCDPWL